MEIPKFWASAQAEANLPKGDSRTFVIWGWSSRSLSEARAAAEERLRQLMARVTRGEDLQKRYLYGSRAIREEIVQELPGGEQTAVLTRNRYGSLVLNAARLLFIDVDLPPAKSSGFLDSLFGKKAPDPSITVLNTLRSVLQGNASTTFRIYRTAAGFRAMAIDREFTPEASETEQLLKLCGADPAFVQLCRLQKCFRARLTPKPWRCDVGLPPSQFPREKPDERQRFEEWLRGYEAKSRGYATCQYLENVGTGTALKSLEAAITLHDSTTRCKESLPLA